MSKIPLILTLIVLIGSVGLSTTITAEDGERGERRENGEGTERASRFNGVITAITDNSVTLRSRGDNGRTTDLTLSLTNKTGVTVNGKGTKPSDLKVGEQVSSTYTGKSALSLVVRRGRGEGEGDGERKPREGGDGGGDGQPRAKEHGKGDGEKPKKPSKSSGGGDE